LEHLRARLSRALGYAQTVVLQCHSIPYGDTQDIEDEIMPPLVNALTTMQECVELYAAVMSTVTLNAAHLRRQAGLGFTTATELADSLVCEAGLPFRLAHKVVATLVQAAVRDGIPSDQLTLARLQAAAQAVLGHELAFSDEQFQRSMDPQHFVDIRSGVGGVAADATAAVLEACAEQLSADEGWFASTTSRLAEADATRSTAGAHLLAHA
jgi:argininosuccinate lyase